MLKHWAEALAARPVGGLPFLDVTSIPARRAACGLAPDADAGLLRVAQRIAEDEQLQTYAWFLFWRIFRDPEPGYMRPGPDLWPLLGELSGPFHQLIALEFAPAVERLHRSRGYPAEVTAATLAAVAGHDGNHRRGQGCPGSYSSQLPWLRMYVHEPYVRLGRLEFEITTFPHQFTVWRQRHDRTVLMLAAEGVRVQADGLVLPDSADAASGWTTQVQHDSNSITGHIVDPAGFIQRKTITLQTAAWELLAKQGDTILAMHIPPGGGMELQQCADSYRRAVDFFTRYHPERQPKLIGCSTWFLDPRLSEILSADANPLRLQRCQYLHPIRPLASGGLWFVFLQRDLSNPQQLPRDSSLRRSLADFLAAGKTWHGGGAFVPFDEADDLREQRYRQPFAQFSAANP